MDAKTAPGNSDSSDIPILRGHYQRAAWYFLRCWLGLVAALVIFGLGLRWASLLLQVSGGVGALIAFLCMLRTLTLAYTARCPECSATMTQGWDSQRQTSDGVFACPQCERRWRKGDLGF